MGKLKDVFFKINAKVPVLKILFWVTLLGNVYVTQGLVDLFAFEPNFLGLYGLEAARTVRARVEEQMRRYKPKPPPPPAAAAQMSYDVRLLRQHNPFLPFGVFEQTGLDKEDKVTDVTGIDLIGTVYSYAAQRRSALIEVNGVAIVVLEGKNIRGTQKKVVEIGRSRITVQEEGLLPAPVYLPQEYGLDDLREALASNAYKTRSNWEYDARYGKKATVKLEEGEEGGGGECKARGEEGGDAEETKKSKKKKAAADEGAAADEEVTDEEAEEEETKSDGGGAGD